MSQLLIITGMNRSGTSLITSIFQQSGLPIGEQLLPAAESNPRGFFEDQAFMLLHEAMLHVCSVTHLVDRGFAPMPNDAETAQASALISERSAQPLWGRKDPRTALFLDFWNGLLPDAGYLFIYRNPLDVLLSLMRRNEPYMAGLLEGLEAWYAYNLRLLRFTAAHPERCILCSVGGVLASIERLRDLLADRTGIQLALTEEASSALYQPDELRQAPATLADIAELAAIHPEAVALYRDLEQRADIAEARNPAWHDRYALPATPATAALRRARLIALCAKLDPATTEGFFARRSRYQHAPASCAGRLCPRKQNGAISTTCVGGTSRGRAIYPIIGSSPCTYRSCTSSRAIALIVNQPQSAYRYYRGHLMCDGVNL